MKELECASCGTGFIERPDRPHTFFAHEMTSCPECGADVEGRVVLRDGGVAMLTRCGECGHTGDWSLGDDAKAYIEAFTARAKVAPGQEQADHLFKTTTSTCPECLKLVLADVVIRDGQVFFCKECRHCGTSSEALVSEDAEYYVDAYTYARAGTEPFIFPTEAEHGCPTDCGTCNDHEQHTCLPIIEITDHCNLECPICIVNNQYANHIDLETFQSMIDILVRNEGFVESIALSGGEPTSHPQLMEILDIATRPEIGRIVVITNGLRLGRSREFAQALSERENVYVGLQFDGFTAREHEVVRGKDLCRDKQRALEMLREFKIPTQLIFVAVRGVNEHHIGRMVEMFLEEDHFISLNFQPMAYTGLGGGQFEHDPMDRLTIPGVIRRVEEQTNGLLKRSDFAPLPCSHPQCVSLTYLLKLNDGSYLPFPRFVDFKEYGGLLRSSATLVASEEMHEIMHDLIHDVFARQDEVERGDEVLLALRRCIDEMFPDRDMDVQEAIAVGEGQAKSIFLHHYMDRYDFDLERLRKCCHHYPQVDGRIMPACGFNMFHRGAAKGEDTPIAPWGKKPWTTDEPTSYNLGSASTRRALEGIAPGEHVPSAGHGIGYKASNLKSE